MLDRETFATSFRPHELGFQTRCTSLTGFAPFPGGSHRSKRSRYSLSDAPPGREVFTGGDTIKEDDVSIRFLQVVLHGARQTFTVLLFVMNDRDTLGFTFSTMYLAAVGP